ncbi:ATP-dependent endonuclease [Edwardsiella tarda]|uniref:ATP-dependent nuclease n=1 Tax=Edwardsiella tarda TaxID=636 RepID=UPI0039BE6DBC
MDLVLKIKNVKSIREFNLTIQIKQGVHAISGSNGIGKSTIMSLLAVPFRPTLLNHIFSRCHSNASVEYELNGDVDIYNNNGNKWIIPNKKIHIDGFIEGSVIYGTRFSDSTIKSLELSDKVSDEHLVDADEFINTNFSYILHGRKNAYPTIKKIKNRNVAQKLGFETVPYFMQYDDVRLSQYWLSSGENLLLSLLHFINNKIFQQKKKGSNEVSLILIDEIELALHPVAIKRMVEILAKLAQEYNLSIYFSSHSTELLRALKPNNIYYLQSLPDKSIEVINPCYPAYATRFLYNQDGYDFLLLVEDELAKFIIEKIVVEEQLYDGKLYHVLPCGDWRNTVRLHKEIFDSRMTNTSAKIISILDGDVEVEYQREKIKNGYTNLNVTYLPIPSLEKYLHEKLVTKVDKTLFRQLNDRFFRRVPLDQVVSEYMGGKIDNKGKVLWFSLVSAIEVDGFSEKEFLREICTLIYSDLKADNLVNRIKAIF